MAGYVSTVSLRALQLLSIPDQLFGYLCKSAEFLHVQGFFELFTVRFALVHDTSGYFHVYALDRVDHLSNGKVTADTHQ